MQGHPTTQDYIAKKIYQEYGVTGLRTLWLCQGFDNHGSVQRTYGLTHATCWWLTSENECTAIMVRDFANIKSEENANILLSMACASPEINNLSRQENALFVPEDWEDSESLLWAVQVRNVARVFFTSYPDMASPLNELYFETYVHGHDAHGSYREPVYLHAGEAFWDDDAALKYLALCRQVWPRNTPSWLDEFLKHGDDEWNAYTKFRGSL